MGNANSSRPSKIQKDRKTEGNGSGLSSLAGQQVLSSDKRRGVAQKRTLQFFLPRSVDTGKSGRAGNGNGKAAAGPSTRGNRDFGKHRHVGATNPFIIFFLRLRSKKPKEPVTVVARAAGKLWSRMSPEQRKKYVDLANAEKKRRQERKRRRRHSGARSR
ncbi:PREDICTED: uncharacterized protein LOC106749190 [Dinoponera quadriceps]|uniref:Uncharacterized protein LOC106749190 n=1 Tax=Dinoponera quadriceps TaxID=609295 RepID=A0A6P3Y0X9_DINQU|nr:PREDICTED: uncharacterized protein LOC106749190 [Dinoponera quadriceps]